jgi:hypothetical protein
VEGELTVDARFAGTDGEVLSLGLESDWSRPLLESTGWLAAHRRNQASLKRNPVICHRDGLAGAVARDSGMSHSTGAWGSWSLRLFRHMPVVSDEHAGLNDA